MAIAAISHRPFATDKFTGLSLPDGWFEVSLGPQRLNAHVENADSSAWAGTKVYLESTSDPGIAVTPATHTADGLSPGASTLFSWNVDMSGASVGAHLVSIAVESGGTVTRLIKKIFVAKVEFQPATGTFTIATPEGSMDAGFVSFVKPSSTCCCGSSDKPRQPGSSGKPNDEGKPVNLIDYLRQSGKLDENFQFCLEQYLLGEVDLQVTMTPPYEGQYGDLPFQDPWWKIALCVLAFLLLVAAAIAEAVDGTGSVSTTGGPGGGGSTSPDCCGLAPSGGGTSAVAAALVAAAAAAATAAGFSDSRDPFRRGADATPPAAGELTVSEFVHAKFDYPEPVALGRPFSVGAKWEYKRTTNAGSYATQASDVTANVHVLSKYVIDAADVYKRYLGEPWVIRAQFFDPNDTLITGDKLFVQCFLCGPHGESQVLSMQDDGLAPDKLGNDGWYTGEYWFRNKKDPKGYWTYYVIAQDVNTATMDLKPEDAAQIIGGLVLTHQLTIDFEGGTCAFVPDGDVNVI